MKVFFLFNGTTHYFNLIVSKINNQPGVEVTYIYPANPSIKLGEGVFQTKEGANFQFVELEEKNSASNYPYFVGLSKLILEQRPDIILVTEVHLKSLFMDVELRRLVDELNIKVVLKSIPFRLEKYDQLVNQLKKKISSAPLPQFGSLKQPFRTFAKFLNLHKAYKKFVVDKKVYKQLLNDLNFKRELYNFPDAHVNYIEEAFDIFGSYGVPKEKIFITYNSPDTDFLFSIKSKILSGNTLIEKKPYRLIHLSRLVKWKRVDMIIQAVANLKQSFPNIELFVVGDGPERENLVRMAQQLNVIDSITFLGAVYNAEDLGKYLMSSSVYVLAGMGGLSINDAMIFGLPVVCSVCDGTEKYLVKEGYNGFIFKEGDQKSLEQKIIKLLSDPDLRESFGTNSVKIIKDEVNIQTVVQGYISAFQYVLAGRSKTVSHY